MVARRMRRGRALSLWLGMTALFFGAGCSGDEEDQDPDYEIVTGEVTGCLQGVVYDGVNKQRVDLSKASMYVVTRRGVAQGLKKVSEFGGLNAEQKTDLLGEYVICKLPFGGQQLPLYLKLEGYQDYVELVTLPNAGAPNRGNENTSPGWWVWPTDLHDITIFKLQDLITNDYTVTVTRRGVYVANARVMLVPQSNRMNAISATTNESGVAIFPASSLAFGTTYDLHVYDPAPEGSGLHASNYGLVKASLVIGSVAGVAGPVVADSVFSVSVEVGTSNEAPVILTQTPAETLSPSGAVTFVFDRGVTPEHETTFLANVAITDYGTKSNGTPCTAADTGEALPTPPTPQIVISVAGKLATITPNWRTAPNLTGCGGTKLTYSWNGLSFVSTDQAVQTSTTLPGTLDVYLTPAGQ